ncbi:Threonine aldolase [Boothiomyces macroporosus]|uniref:Threonine aldolase n=1 Tax=Boothiomyces macroporosus TaxID=261099 RepID=A0AAD5UGB5_9FUNG|nr:Threonine aldolase [Boothiomyces macroporosus]
MVDKFSYNITTKPSNTLVRTIADFRSDTVTKPTAEMSKIIAAADVGDDVFDDDPSIHLLQDTVAQLAGKEAGLFCASGTMTNQLAIRTHLLQPPYSVVCDTRAHVNSHEAGGIAFHSSAMVIPLMQPDGSHLTAELIEKNWILDDDVHHAPTKLVCLENTLAGRVFPFEEQVKISNLAHANGVKMHLDGARLWNAIVKNGQSLKEACSPFDSVSLCFSKGLGAPIGSVLVGSKEFIKKARHFRKVFGGGWRQAGGLATACLFVLNNHLKNLEVDHANAACLSKEFERLGLSITIPTETNMVWVDFKKYQVTAQDIMDLLAPHGIKVLGGGSTAMRFVCHHQVSREAIEKTVSLIEEYLLQK